MSIFNISDGLRAKVQQGFDDLINVLGKGAKVCYPPIMEPCSNCYLDIIGNKSSNHYKTGGPMPFSAGFACPACNSSGKRSKEVFESVALLRAYDERSFFYPVKDLNIKFPDGFMQIQGFLTDLPKVRRAEYFIFDEQKDQVYKLGNYPMDDNNIVQGRYFYATLAKMSNKIGY